jgi:hypothetical protein
MKFKKCFLLAVLIAICSNVLLLAESDDKAGEQINWQVLSSGGTNSSSPGYKLQGTLDQTGVGWSTSDQYMLHSGFWQVFGEAPYLCGDANGDNDVNVSDCVYIINYVFIFGSPPPDPIESGETNCDGDLNVSDAVYLINYVFIFGSPPPCDVNADGTPDC